MPLVNPKLYSISASLILVGVLMLLPITVIQAAGPASAVAACKEAETIPIDQLDGEQTVISCRDALSQKPDDARLQYSLGRALQHVEDYEKAFQWYRKSADQEYAPAIGALGFLYAHGHGVKQDATKAVDLYRNAAEQGYSGAQSNLGYMYATGRGVAKDDDAAVSWFQKAVEQGDSSAQNNLGFMYLQGYGVEQNEAEAAALFLKAAEQGDPEAQANLGYMYEAGRGVEKDDAEAVAWYRKAAEQGEEYSIAKVAYAYEQGKGVNQDDEQAVDWYIKAVELGNAFAQWRLGVLLAAGRGAARDRARAAELFEKAIEGGEELAIYDYEKLTASREERDSTRTSKTPVEEESVIPDFDEFTSQLRDQLDADQQHDCQRLRDICGGRICSETESGEVIYNTVDGVAWYHSDGRLASREIWQDFSACY